MSLIGYTIKGFAIALFVLSAGYLFGQVYRNNTVRITDGGADGENDFTACQIGQGMR